MFEVEWSMIVFYVVGTVFGLWAGRKMQVDDVVDRTLEVLIENNFVKHTIDENGEIELIPLDDK